MHSFKIKTYDEDTGYGLLRHVLVRRGFHSGEVMVVLVLGSPVLPSKNNFVKALRKLHPEISTVIINVNDKRTSMVLGDKESVIYGKGYIEDTLCGCTFRISPKSFYQVNPVQTELLYGKAIAYAALTGNETVVDAYCGTGTIGIIAAKSAKKVIGVELNRDAVRDAVKKGGSDKKEKIIFFTTLGGGTCCGGGGRTRGGEKRGRRGGRRRGGCGSRGPAARGGGGVPSSLWGRGRRGATFAPPRNRGPGGGAFCGHKKGERAARGPAGGLSPGGRNGGQSAFCQEKPNKSKDFAILGIK